MKRNEYKAGILSRLGMLTENKALPEAELNMLIKHARIWIAETFGIFDERYQDVKVFALGGAAIAEYETLPSDFLKALTVSVNNYPARRISFAEYEAIDENSYFTPSPTDPIWFTYKNLVGVSPTSASTNASMYYIRTPTAFSDDTTDETGLTAPYIWQEYQPLVILKACEGVAKKFKPDWDIKGEIAAEMQKIAQEKGYDIKGTA